MPFETEEDNKISVKIEKQIFFPCKIKKQLEINIYLFKMH